MRKLSVAHLFVWFLLPLGLLSQKKVKLESVVGEWVLSNDITLPQAREKAINQAKVEALRLAGVPESIFDSSISFKSDKQGEMKEVFESLTSVNTFGEILDFDVETEGKIVNEFGNVIYKVTIDATIIVHNEAADRSFVFEVNGIRDKYQSLDKLVFEITPRQDGYMQVFILEEDDANMLFPNMYEPQELLKGNVTVKFPRSKGFDYEVSSKTSNELNHLIFCFTKNDIPFAETESLSSILRFIGSISPPQKSVQAFTILIQK